MAGMLSKRRIEQQLAHFKDGCASTHDPAQTSEIAGWIAALEWVLGDEKHRAGYEEFTERLNKSFEWTTQRLMYLDRKDRSDLLEVSKCLGMALARLE
jgi:hypothetical protein